MGTDDTTLIGKVEPSSFVAVGDRLLVHFNSSYGTACLVDTRTATKKSIVAVERGNFQEKHEVEACLDVRIFRIWRIS